MTLRSRLNVLLSQFAAELSAAHQQLSIEPRYNIAPTQEIIAIRRKPDPAGRELLPMRWGLVPPWSENPASGPPLINARADTVATKPSFRSAFKKRRCLIPADGFYEWQKLDSRTKQPHYIHRPDNQPFAFAGLWERWDRGPVIESCVIVTTGANKMMGELHDRMPVILSPNDYDLWLDPTVDDPAALQYLLTQCGDHELVAEPISTYVNKVGNDGPKCIEPMTQSDGAGLLF